MNQQWYIADRELFERERALLVDAYGSDLILSATPEEDAKVAGAFGVIEEIGYSVDLRIPHRYPIHSPSLFVDPEQIPHHVDWHVYPQTGQGCLCVLSEMRRWWPVGSTLVDFFENLVRPYFVGQYHKKTHGHWPEALGERSHNEDGIIEAYQDFLKLLGTVTIEQIDAFMGALASSAAPKGHHYCPCGSRRRLRTCHGELVRSLREFVYWEHAAADRRSLRSFLTRA